MGKVNQQQLVDRLRRAGIRVTRRRLCVAEVVLNTPGPVSVHQICVRVRNHFPSTTRACIQSALGALETSGLIHKLPFQNFSSYEANLEPHISLVCTECGMVMHDEMGQGSVDRLKEQISCQSSFQVAWQRVDFYGLCTNCAPSQDQLSKV